LRIDRDSAFSSRKIITAGLLLAMFMAAVEATIIATAMPRIVAELGGFALYGWAFSAYLLSQVVTIPIYGRLADLLGRKPVFVTGVTIFLVGSLLCGLSRSMPQLIAFRFIQGIGSGAVMPIAVTLIGDLYPLEQRPRVQGWTSSVWAVSAIVGPPLGGVIVDYFRWSWIFFLNLLPGVVAIAVVMAALHENVVRRPHAIDYAGAGLLVAFIGSLMLALLHGGTAWPWRSPQSIGLFGLAAAAAALLLVVETRVTEPIFPVALFGNPLIAFAGAAGLFQGAVLIGLTAMVPTFVQGVLGAPAILAGSALAAMSIGWPLASFLTGRVMRAIGYRLTAILGSGLTVVGSGALVLAGRTPLEVGAGVFLVGMGLGFASNAFIVSIQEVVPWENRGAATAGHLFMRSLGNTLGVAAVGSLLNAVLLSRLAGSATATRLIAGGHALDAVNILLRPGAHAKHSAVDQVLLAALGGGIHAVFIAITATAAVGLLLTLFLPAALPASGRAAT